VSANGKGVRSDFAVDQIERELLHGILTGRYRGNDCLPSIERLCGNFGVAYQTVRFAIGRLLARGLLIAVPGEGTKVVELQSSVDLRLLFEVINEAHSEPVRKWNLIAQVCGFLRFMNNEIVDRAARHRDDTQLEWMRHMVRMIADRIAMNGSRRDIGECELQLIRVLAASSGCITHTAIINSMRSLFLSDLLVAEAKPMVPVEDYWKLMEAIANKDPARAREIMDAAWWRLEEHCIEELKKLGWTETPTGATPGES
jgi:DNA-binding FadR family transcriptional regulator